ncbi:type II secretion system F family protein [Microbacterium sp. VKM Ac-2923]|uniref:type II secretion system F family protein n=1 Tax=Microbacterium sp. VKM Ac-2923 TaxID=2929476 RepID=UPI001FB32326|nr:type II secretion system F family protein [Microbacterium sp. VKM Ac-2923]MCJ1708642.1 type II secretion system F family protein [Microbacterium sp. VKM Ac-2923]
MRFLLRRRPIADPADAIETVLRLAVLLSAGLPAVKAWAHLADDGDPIALSAARAAAAGDDVGSVLAGAGGSWADVAAVWTVAVETGAPLAGTLRTVSESLRDAAEVAADVRVALAEPAATARLLSWLPLLGVPMGAALGFDSVGILFSDAVGMVCLGAGTSLVVVSHAWSRRLSRRARPPTSVPGLRSELWAVALSAGVSADRARSLVDAVAPRRALDERSDGATDTVEFAHRAGVPAAELLRADAWLARQRARTEGRTAAARLSTRLLLPLGLCTLPAFLFLAVAPMMLGILRGATVP